jgi:hypothetical protein
MFRASSAHHQESLTVHTASSFCVCVCLWHCLVRSLSSYHTVPQTDTITETGGCMYGEGLLIMSAWRSKHVELYTHIPCFFFFFFTDFLFNYLFDLPEITSYLLQIMTLGKLHSGSSVSSTDYSSPGSHFL